jgi:iron-sulfur cluster assembly protein
MAVTLTPAARDRVRQYQAATPGTIGLRFGVKKSGCSGWSYLIDMAADRRADEVAFEDEGVLLLVDEGSLEQVDGTVIDFVSQGLNQQFVFRNPRVAAECGCGESFTTDDSAA